MAQCHCFRGSGSDPVVRTVTSVYGDPQFESNHQQNVDDMGKAKFVLKQFNKLRPRSSFVHRIKGKLYGKKKFI